MKRLVLISACVLALALPATVLASGSSRGSVPSAQRDPQAVTETMTCKILEVTEKGVVLVEDVENGSKRRFAFDQDIQIKTRLKEAFDGRRSLEAADLAAAQTLKVVHRPATGEVIRITIVEVG